MSDKCARCGHSRVFHQVGTGNGVPVGKEYCDDRHAAPCSCEGFVMGLFDLKISEQRAMKAYEDRVFAQLYGYSWLTLPVKVPMNNYKVYHTPSGKIVSQWPTEAEAIKDAESRASHYAGEEYLVLKAVTKSVAPKAVTTTRL